MRRVTQFSSNRHNEPTADVNAPTKRRTTIDTYLAIASLRVVREYSSQPIADESLRHVLEAGRVTGSSQNRQHWKFYVVRDRDRLIELADTVFEPDNLRRCRVAVALVSTGKGTFDIGRCAQNMVLAAWNEGIGSSPNGFRDMDAAVRLLGVPDGETLVNMLSLGYPAHPHQPRADDLTGILQRIKRKPLEELVVWVQ